jgi:hypothetical protein
MSESIQLRDPLFRLVLRFSNGETVQHVMSEAIDTRKLSADTRYAIITSVSIENPNELADISVVNLRDVTFIKTERVTLDQLATEKRMAGIRGAVSSNDGKIVKSLAQINFI